MVSTSAGTSPAGLPRWPCSSRWARSLANPACTAAGVHGGSNVTRSASSSVKIPPAAMTRTWPNCGSTTTPIRISATPSVVIRSTNTRSDNTAMRSAADWASAAVPMYSATPPTSDLCSRWAPTALTTTGKPRLRAADAAASVATTQPAGTVTP